MVSLSTALHQFEQSLQELVTQLNDVSGSLRPDDIQLSRSLMVVCQQAVRLRVLIRAEDPQATWSNHQQLREVVEQLENRVPLRSGISAAEEGDAGGCRGSATRAGGRRRSCARP